MRISLGEYKCFKYYLVKKHEIVNQRRCWMIWKSYLCKQVILFRCKGCFKGFPVIKYTYVACLRAAMRFVFAIYGLFIFMFYWTEAYVKYLRWTFLRKQLTSVYYFGEKRYLNRVLNTPLLNVK